ncbi:nuclease-like protein [Metamycoplasma subdolum]|uniref:Nuclease-like protein n=2 Tax=Metamycoplasma subdolum TaxID=92407 RepID=A0A3M0A3Y8_9BACT|nr:nuclease-like protein [Metamycoplasma subdolum]
MNWKILAIVFAVAIFAVILVLLLFFLLKKKNDHNKTKNNESKLNFKSFFTEPFDQATGKEMNEIRGIQGENIVNSYLNRLVLNDEYLLTNVLLPVRKGNTEIDSILITRKGIFCIEIKNWIGKIIGNDADLEWIQIYRDARKESKLHKNPVKQNEKHCGVLSKYLNYDFKVYNLVLFSNIEDGSKLFSEWTFDIKYFYKNYHTLPDILSDEQIQKAASVLIEYQANTTQLEMHKKEIKSNFSDNN